MNYFSKTMQWIHKDMNSKGSDSFSRGFSLVEVMVAIAIFSIAITGVITAAAMSGINVNNAKNRLEANYLAQESIEIMRAKRDSYVLSSGTSYQDGWQNFVTAVLGGGCSGPCDVDESNLNYLVPSSGSGFYSCVNPGVCDLRYSSQGFYTHGTGTYTPFTREITVVPFIPIGSSVPSELEITSTVWWKEGIATRSLSMSESLFGWYGTH